MFIVQHIDKINGDNKEMREFRKNWVKHYRDPRSK